MNVIKSNYEGNPHIGLFIFCNDVLCFVGNGFREDQRAEIAAALKVPLYPASMMGSPLVGLFMTGNNKVLFVPHRIEKNEFDYLNEICQKHQIRLVKIATNLTALGNNLLCNDHGCIANPDFSSTEIKEMQAALEQPVVKSTIASFEIVGSLARTTSHGLLVCEDVLPEEKKIIEECLQQKAVEGSINNSRYISSGVVANKYGGVICDQLFGAEILPIKDALFR